jgi:hypothetical protein
MGGTAMLRLQVLLLAVFLAFGVARDALAGPTPEPLEDTAVKETARALLRKGDLRGLDALATAFRHSRERTPSGSWKLGLVYLSITQDLFAPADPRWETLQQAAGEWLAENPDSPSAVALDARLLRAHAWAWHDAGEMRGDNNPQYRQLLERARRVLDEHPDANRQDPEWDALRIAIAREQGSGTDQILRMGWEALEREGYYYPLHEAVTNKLMPQWGGSRQAVEQYAQMALAHSANQEGTQAYARIYYYIARSAHGDPGLAIGEMGLKWSLMEQSLAEVMQAYPSAFNRDIARSFTCFTRRSASIRALGRADTTNIVPVAWWDTPQWRQSCNEFAFEGKYVPAPLSLRLRAYVNFLRTYGDVFWERIRLTVFVTFFVLEGALALLAWLWSARAPAWPESAAASRAFNPMDYPRTYAVAASREPNFIRLSVWMLFLGGASTYVLAHVDTPDPLELQIEQQILMALCVMVALTGALMIFSRFTARVVLEPDAVTVRALVGGGGMKREDILGVREYQRSKGPRLIELVSRREAAPLRLPPVRYEDGPFRVWFDSLPALALPAVRGAGVLASRTAPKTR